MEEITVKTYSDFVKNKCCNCCGGSGLQTIFDYITTGKYLQERRKSKKLKLKDISFNSGFSISYISNLEQGRKKINKQLFEDIENAINGRIKF